MDRNPYAPTKAALAEKSVDDATGERVAAGRLASRGQRITNDFIDQLIILLLVVAFVIKMIASSGDDPEGALLALGSAPIWLVASGLRIGYYVVLEATLGRTLGKFVSGTRVVTESGGKPTVGQILLRSLVRLVPFEWASFLGSSPGWHDRWSKTRVIRTRGV
jgi:uncharacterized RDD family membrane protein YckC